MCEEPSHVHAVKAHQPKKTTDYFRREIQDYFLKAAPYFSRYVIY